MNRNCIVGFTGLTFAAMSALLFGVAGASAAITIATVPVGNAGNAADTTGFGAVGYGYNIGKYDVTAGQYTAFLNAVAATDTNALYNTSMAATDLGSGITRNGVSGGYIYTVDPSMTNRPVNYVSFWDSTRFANWLANGQPTGAQGPGTTETGTYALTPTAIANNTVTRSGSSWAVTSEDEWYKAAYYKGGSENAGYWLYATQSNATPGNNLADPSGNNANYYTGVGPYPIDGTHYTTIVGQFANSGSAYGTFDQNGNVFQWNEAIISGAWRGVRGGSVGNDNNTLQSGSRYINFPSNDFVDVGFRVSQVPEPTSLAVLALGVVALGSRRRVTR